MNDIVHHDLIRRMQQLDRAWHAMYGSQPRRTAEIAAQAQWWVEALEGTAAMSAPDDGECAVPAEAAASLLEYLIPQAEQRGSAFWGTALGRAIALTGRAPTSDAEAAGGAHLGPRVPGSIAAAVLGMSRQRVFELQKAGRLCTPAQIASALHERGATA